jgi:S-DNA-T family DNA segregation ATPase FtsK/SpoIIIE
LVRPDGRPVELPYGRTRLGDLTIDVHDRVTARSTGGSAARVGGAALLGSTRLRHGDLLTAAGSLWTVEVRGRLVPPPRRGWTRPHRGRGDAPVHHEPVTVQLPTPPAQVRLPGFPVLSATVPLLMGVAVWVATGSLLSAGFMLFSVVFVVASGLEARREARADDRARVHEHRQDLEDACARLDELAEAQRRRHRSEGWSPAELHELLTGGDRPADRRIWHRDGDGIDADDATHRGWTVRLGTATRRLEDLVTVPDQGRRALRRELVELSRQRSRVDDVATLDLAACGVLVIEGADEHAVAVARSMVLQLTTAIGPDHLHLRILAPPDRLAAWSALSWVPHRSSGRGRRLLVVDGVDPTDELGYVANPDDGDDVSGDPIVVWLASSGADRPTGCGAVLVVDGDRGRFERTPEGIEPAVDEIALEPLEHEECEPLARGLAGLAPATGIAVHGDGTTPAHHDLPDRVSLAEVTATPDLLRDPDGVVAQWRGTEGTGSLATPIGRDGRGGTVNLDLSADGPHALVAGTTGAGKSELLRTFLVAAALHHSPQRLQMLLVDYKGGAAFGPLTRLPHTVGTITDLSGALAPRALASLRAELRRREEAVAAAGAERWDGPALLVVVDELATLVAEQPHFVDGLVDLAQRGRSLGVHLLLATQRPAGVITDAIRANVTMRIALRVADEDDSRDVVDAPLAAHLPRRRPGRAVVRVGPGATTALQTAYCGAALRSRSPVSVRRLDDPGPPGVDVLGGPTELELAVRTLEAAATRTGFDPPPRPWVDPLPERVGLGEIAAPERAGSLVIGLVDRPERQRHEPLRLDLLRDGGAVVIGAGGSGRTTVVRTLAAAAASAEEAWQVHVIDSGGALAELAGRGVVGDVVATHDTERVTRLLRDTVEQIVTRRAGDGSTDDRRLLVVDGIAAFEERHERRDRGLAMDLLGRVARDGRSVGVHLVLTAHRRSEVPVALAGLLGARIVLRCATADDAALLDLDDDAADPEAPPGRCHVAGHRGQIAVDDLGAALATPATGARPGVARLRVDVARTELPRWDPTGWRIPVGIDADSLEVAALDLRHHHAIVAGPPRSGVSTVLASIAGAVPGSHLIGRGDVDGLDQVVDAAVSAAARGTPALVAVDDLADLLDGPDQDRVSAALEELVRAGRDLPVRVVLGGEVDALSRSYLDVVATVRRGRTGILLGDDPETHGGLWHAALVRRDDLPAAPGRGWLLGPGSARAAQFARP